MPKSQSKSQVTILAYAKCQTCNNAIKWLSAHGISPVVRPIVDEPPTLRELAAWVPASGVSIRKWLNTSGQSYRALGKAKFDEASDADIARWLSEDGKLVKRPVLVLGDAAGASPKAGSVLVGFRPESYDELFR